MSRLCVRIAPLLTVSLIGMALLCTTVAAQSVKVEGLIKARNGDTMIVNTSGSSDVAVLLTDSTQVGQVQGVLKARRKQMSMAALIPGLKVKVEGSYNDQKQLVATSVAFKGNDLQDAEKIEAGMHETKAELAKHKPSIRSARIYAFVQADELDSKRAKFFERINKLAKATCKTVVAINDDGINTSLTARS